MWNQGFKYTAFISYKHGKLGRKWAKWLVEELERYRMPEVLVKEGWPKRIGKIYRDEDEFSASSNLHQDIKDALEASENLIVICSKVTPSSSWVNQEIEFFRSLGRGQKIYALLIEGEPEDSFPEALWYVDETGSRIQPAAADARVTSELIHTQIKKVALRRLVAGVVNCDFDDLMQRERFREILRRRKLYAFLGCLVAIGLLSSYYWWDQNRFKSSYFVDYAERYGLPIGVSEVKTNEVKSRHRTWEFRVKRGLLRSVTYVDSYGVAHPNQKFSGVEMNLQYQENSLSLRRLSFLDKNGKVISTQEFEFSDDLKQAIIEFKEGFGKNSAQLQTTSVISLPKAEKKPDYLNKTNITRHRIFFDTNGFAVRKMYESTTGRPVRDDNYSYGQFFRYSPNGQPIVFGNIDQSGVPLRSSKSVVESRIDYDGKGNVVSRSYWNTNNELMVETAKNCAKVIYKYEISGNLISEQCLGVTERPVLNKNNYSDRYGYARKTFTYDSRGNQTEQAYWGVDDSPVLYNVNGGVKVGHCSGGILLSRAA